MTYAREWGRIFTIKQQSNQFLCLLLLIFLSAAPGMKICKNLVCSSQSCYGLSSTNDCQHEGKQGGGNPANVSWFFSDDSPFIPLNHHCVDSFIAVQFCVILGGLLIRLWWWCFIVQIGIKEVKGECSPSSVSSIFQILSQLFSFLPQNFSNDIVYLFVWGLSMPP